MTEVLGVTHKGDVTKEGARHREGGAEGSGRSPIPCLFTFIHQLTEAGSTGGEGEKTIFLSASRVSIGVIIVQ